MTFFIGLAVGLLLLVPFLGSLFICVPKWWGRVVEPRLPVVSYSPGIDWRRCRWYLAPIRWAYMLVVFPLFLGGLLVVGYILGVFAFIEQKCPYSHSNTHYRHPDFSSRRSWIDYDMLDYIESMWDFTMGRR